MWRRKSLNVLRKALQPVSKQQQHNISNVIRSVSRAAGVISVGGSFAGAQGRRISTTSAYQLAKNPFAVADDCLLPGLPAEEFRARREKLFEAMPEDSAFIVPAATTKYMTNDIPYEFRQNSNFSYLTGLEEPEAIALMLKTKSMNAFVLLVRPRDRDTEQWDGDRVGLDEAQNIYGADEAFSITSMQNVFQQLLKGMQKIFVLSPEGGRFPPAFLDATKPFHQFFYSGDYFLDQLRVVKSEAELDRMRVAAKIGVQGFKDMIAASKPDMTENALASFFESSCKRNGALWNSFPCVVASGPNAAVIHYLTKRNLLSKDELVLVDSGCEVAGGYVSDITRTWPVDGKFSNNAQLTLYEMVLRIQKNCLEKLSRDISSGTELTLDGLHKYSVDLFLQELKDLRILTGENVNVAQYMKYNPTHIGHYLGMDVHDTPQIPRSIPLQSGMVMTVEPGIYFPKNDASIPAEFRGIGIRIEDDVVIHSNRIEVLTKDLPKDPSDLEKLKQT